MSLDDETKFDNLGSASGLAPMALPLMVTVTMMRLSLLWAPWLR